MASDETPAPTLVDNEDALDDDALVEIGEFVQYTDEKGKIRAAVVIFILRAKDEERPVLRVFVPMAPLLGGMPAVGLVAPASMCDIEVYGPLMDHDESVPNTWRSLN